MTTPQSSARLALFAAALTCITLAGSTPQAQAATHPIPDRIAGPIDNTSRAPLPGSTPPRAMRSTDLGALSPDSVLPAISLVFSRSDAQEADLDQLIADQQNPASPQYHQWLTPAQFGARFGVSDNDLAATESWLQSQGFSVVSVSPSRSRIIFSGRAAAVESAFGAPLHYFRATSGSLGQVSDSLTHVAPAHDLTLPAALSSIVLAVGNLSDYRPQSHAIQHPTADFTSSVSGSHYMTPKDVATIYDLNPAYSAGYNGSGQTIVVAAQTNILLSDVANFQSAAGVATNTPNIILIPNTGSSAIYTGDEAEADLDAEYTSSIANKATIDFIYTGNSPYYGVFDSFIYAIDNQIGTIITISYGQCELDLGQSSFNQYEAYLKQAATQGQTVINSSGDSGSTGCYGASGSTAFQQQLAVSYPASSAYVTGLGGTEFPSAYTAGTNSTYFAPATNSTTDNVGSALSYIPEMTWNDDAASGSLSSGGGGVSIYSARPTWQQAGVNGVPSGSFRLVPDISLDSSPNDAGYIYCTSDTGSQGISFSNDCSVGFRNTTGGSLAVAGGTSFAAPIFAGMLAILNQAKGYNLGQGLINPTLYTLAANSATYASAFHDILPTGTNITVSGNQCLAGSAVCGTGAATTSYVATTGYDQATGLGSVDLYKLIQAWPANTATTSTLLTTAIGTTVNSFAPAVNSTDGITLQVTCTSGSLCTGTAPTGKVSVSDTVNGTTAVVSNSPVTLSGGSAIFTYNTPGTGGVHQLSFTYSGDANYATSKATVFLNVGSSGFTLSAPAVSVTSGSSTTASLIITPTGGYTGTVNLSLYNSSIANACFSGPTAIAVSSSSPVTATYTIYTGVSICPSGAVPLRKTASTTAASNSHSPAPGSPWRSAPIPATLAGLLILGCFKRSSRLLRAGIALGAVLVLGLSGLSLTGCGNGSSGTVTTGTGTTTTTGTPYSISVVGNDSLDNAVASSTTFTLTVN